MKNVDNGNVLEERVLRDLKDFQRRTVDYAFERLYESDDPTNRFLVADEVGLGKTLVARGLIARIINRLKQSGAERADILYICSNANIASQNIKRLNVTQDAQFTLSTRITLLPRDLAQLRSNGLNFISFTPGTSFNMVSRTGLAEERAVIFRLLEYALNEDLTQSPGAYRALRGASRDKRFRGAVRWTERVAKSDGAWGLDLTLAEAFKSEFLDIRGNLPDRFRRCRANEEGSNDWEKRASLILRLRQALARSCISALKPDFVILDEFQRFRDLLDVPDAADPNDIRQLSHQLFSRPDTRLLLLSATPYKMYTLHDEAEDNHYEDFLRVARFLMGPEEEAELRTDLDAFRGLLRRISHSDNEELIHRKQRIEDRLRRFMSRTERLATSSDRNGMLSERTLEDVRLSAGDLLDYRAVDQLSRKLSSGDSTEYWKSSPYLVNFMGNYKLKRELKRATEDAERSAALVPILQRVNQLPVEEMKTYGHVEAGNARIRGLLASMLDQGAWKLPWIPPSLPYYRGTGAWADDALQTTTKRLIFSSWNVVPDALSMLLSYEAERNMMLAHDPDAENSQEYRARHSGLLTIRRDSNGPASMSTFALLYPSAVLAELADPLEIARDLGAGTREVSVDEVLSEATRRIRDALQPHLEEADTSPSNDSRWYWAAPLLLDRAGWPTQQAQTWLSRSKIARDPGRIKPDHHAADTDHDHEPGAWADHIDQASAVIQQGMKLGAPPPDLAGTLAMIALGGPGSCALRALARTLGAEESHRDVLVEDDFRDAAFRIAWGFRTLFNLPTITSLIRHGDESDRQPYWMRVAACGVAGNLQAVLDEYCHVLPEWLGLLGRDRTQAALRVANGVHDAVTIRASNYWTDEVAVCQDRIKLKSHNIRVRFALRFGTTTSDDHNQLVHANTVRSAFNSPFWPFVLTTTSVGQEGLDFHQYCHAVVHWNLPANPVDLEQREGRIHRYKGHAVRKNVAERHRAAAFGPNVSDPWARMFDEASAGVTRNEHRDIAPFWVYEGKARIERHVPHLPLSREVAQLRRLKRSLAAYRMVIGQPRQEDLLRYLEGRLPEDELIRLMRDLRIDLSPKS